MSRQSLLAALCLVLWAAGQALVPAGAEPPAQAPRHVLLKFKPGAEKELVQLSEEDALQKLLASLSLPKGARLEEPPLSRWLRNQHPNQPRPVRSSPVDLGRFLYLHLPPGLSVAECVARLENHPWIEYVEPDGVGTGAQTIPNDPSFSLQWYHRNLSRIGADIHTPAAWDVTTGSTNVVVAMIDTGLNLSLPEFSGRLVPGFDFANGDADPTDDNGHGTGVAGVLCATGNNSILVAGVDWKCRLMPLKALDQNNIGLFSWWAQAVDFAVTNGAKVINLSAGGSGSSTSLTRAITNAIARGVIFVTITHNDGTDVIRYPGNLPVSITVGATDSTDQRASFSNHGPEIDLVAPGDGIYTLSRNGTVTVWQGTSFAAPQVAGACALLASIRPGLTQEEALYFLTAGAEDQVGDTTDTPGFDPYYGFGRLNVHNSILLAAAQPTFLRQPESQTVVQGDTVSFQVEMAGAPPFGYQWQRDGTLVMPFQQGGPTLTLTNIQPTNAGLYRVLVTNMANPSPGVLSAPADLVVLADSDGDHVPDEWESQNGLSPNDPSDGEQDKDGDRLSNREEYLAGTDPSDPESCLRLERIQASPTGLLITFTALSNRTYSLLYHRLLTGGEWARLADFESRTTNRTITILDPRPPFPSRFYRLATPKRP